MNSGRTIPRAWAPWWVYVAVIAPANLGKEALLPADAAWWVRAGLTLVILVTGIALVTAIVRGGSGTRSQEGEGC